MLLTLVFATGVFLVCWLALLALDAVFQATISHGSDVLNQSVTITGDAKDYGEITITGTTPQDIALAFDPDDMKAYYFLSDVAGSLVTTNNPAGTPDTIVMVANEPIFWNNKMVWTNGHFANRGPWTKLTFTGSGSTNGTLKYFVIRDGSP